MWEAISTIFGGGFLGTLVGGVFAYLNSRLTIQTKKMELDNRVKMRELDIQYMAKEGELALQRESLIQEGQTQKTLAKAKESAYKYDKRTYSDGIIERWQPKGAAGQFFKGLLIFLMGLVDVARGMTRPVMTWYSALAATLLGVAIFKMSDEFKDLKPDHVYQITIYFVAFTFHLVGMAWSFWFCERNMTALTIGPSGSRAVSPIIPPTPTQGGKDADLRSKVNSGDVDGVNDAIERMRRKQGDGAAGG